MSEPIATPSPTPDPSQTLAYETAARVAAGAYASPGEILQVKQGIQQELLAAQVEAWAATKNPEQHANLFPALAVPLEAAAASMDPADLKEQAAHKRFRWPLRPTIRERLYQWTNLSARAAAIPPHRTHLVPVTEAQTLWREYEYLRAWQQGMVTKVVLFQVLVVALISIAWYMLSLDTAWAKSLEPVAPYLRTAFWGVLGACTASL